MALAPAQIALTAEIVRESYTTVETKVSSLNAAQESLLSDDIDLWESERNSADFKMKGGSSGIILDTTPLLADIFYRVRNMLGLELISYDLNGSTMEIFELEVGQNFG